MNTEPQHSAAWLAVLIPIIVLIALFDGVMKCIGMWKSARNNQLAWFVCLALLNTAGILPIIYLTCCQKDRNQPTEAPKV